MHDDAYYMRLALEEAQKANDLEELPIGAVLVDSEGEVVARGHNMREVWHDATAHAEMIAIREACAKQERWRLSGLTLYVTIEPCPMCAGAIVMSRVDRVVYGMDYSKVALIITEKYEAIATAIDSQLDRGVTLLKGQGYYKRQDKMVLLSAVQRKQLAELKELVMDIDPDAFIILQDAHQVLGDGFKRYDRNEL